MVFVRKSIDIISPSDGKHYTSITQYEKSLDKRGQHIMSDREYKTLSERCYDESKSAPKTKPVEHNHIHIDFANGRVEKSKVDIGNKTI